MARGLLNFVVVGAKNSGKTVFLSTLFGMEPSVATANKETTDYLKDIWKELKNGDLPTATSSRVITLEFEYKTDTYSVDFCLDDYDGYFIETLSSDEEQAQEDRNKLKKNIKEAEGLLFFFPFEKTFDEESLSRFRHEINTFIQIIKDIYPNQKDLPIPAVIAVSKWDRSADFGAQNQNKKAVEYLDSVEAYRAAMEMINSFFADTKVVPVSSFGNTDDGVHPIKGKIEPYNLREPFDYFLDVTFQKFEKKANELRTTSDLLKLYEFLTAIYNDVRFYQEGKLTKLHSLVETEYATDVIEKLRAASGPSEQSNILSAHSFLCNNIKDKNLADEIEAAVTGKRLQRNKRRVIFSAILIFAAIIFGYGVLAYRAYEKEQNTFMSIQQLKPQNVPKELSERCKEYLESYTGKSFFLPFTDVLKHREYVEATLSSVKAKFFENLTKEYSRLKSQGPDDLNLVELKDLQANADLFPDAEISRRIMEFYEQFLKRIETKEQTTRILNEAKALIASDPDLSEVENILAQLNELPDDKETTEIKEKLSQRLRKLQLQSEFNQLYNEVKEEKRIREIKIIVSIQWRKDFPEEFAQTLRILIQNKIAEEDGKAINDLQSRFESVTDVAEQERILAEIGGNFIEIPQLSFRYERSQHLKEKFQKGKISTEKYKSILNDGVLLEYITFGATQKDNQPLKFACGFFKGDEILLKFGNQEYSYKKDPKPVCTGNGDGRQEIEWQAGFKIMPGTYHVDVTEVDQFKDDSINATLEISKKDILYIYNRGKKEFEFERYPGYFILLSKQGQ